MPRLDDTIGFLVPFTLGALVGIPLSLSLWWILQLTAFGWLIFAIVCPLTGFLAVRYGEDFWETILRAFPWF